MAKTITFKLDNEYSFSIEKLDRKKLYGWKEVHAIDNEGKKCIKVEIDESGQFIIPKGGKALGMLDEKGSWVDRKDLNAVYKDSNKPAELIPSTFNRIIELDKLASMEEFLNHNISSVYILEAEEGSEELIEKIKNANGVYKFIFNYRQDYEGSSAFILEKDGKLFVLVGYESEFEFIGLEQAVEYSVEDEEDFSLEEDLDFSMM